MPEGLDVLTNREREVTVPVARALFNDEIAAYMVISPATAKTHVSRTMTKVHARDRHRQGRPGGRIRRAPVRSERIDLDFK